MLGTRIATGLVLAALVTTITLVLPTPLAAVAFGVIWLLGAREWALLASLSGWAVAAYVGVAGLIMLGLWLLGIESRFVGGILWIAACAWLIALAAISRFPLRMPPGLVFAAGFRVLTPAWAAIARIHAAGGPALALAALAVIWGADVGAFFVGRTLGRRKLAPRVSPGKTWEGLAGGLAAALAAGAAACYWLVEPAVLIAVAGIAALVSVVGDLTVSMLKRSLGLKDTGHLLPGHGGVLDRIDGLTAALPIFAIGLQLAGLLD
jgi:phosphatidate cytidylyltransferase